MHIHSVAAYLEGRPCHPCRRTQKGLVHLQAPRTRGMSSTQPLSLVSECLGQDQQWWYRQPWSSIKAQPRHGANWTVYQLRQFVYASCCG